MMPCGKDLSGHQPKIIRHVFLYPDVKGFEKMRKIIVGTVLLGLGACATPREQCETAATKDYNVLLGAISVTQGNIARGYAVHKQTVPYTYASTCYYGTVAYSCPQTGYRTQETPVAINVGEERRTLRALQSKVSAYKVRADEGIRQCAVQFPE